MSFPGRSRGTVVVGQCESPGRARGTGVGASCKDMIRPSSTLWSGVSISRVGQQIGFMMIRHCDGQDPNLVDEEMNPCACGLTFDDVDHEVIYPHRRLPTREEREAMYQAAQDFYTFRDQVAGSDGRT